VTTSTDTPPVDLIDVLLEQHARAEELFRAVSAQQGDLRREALRELIQLLSVHETAEEELVHPLARHNIDAGDEVVEARLAEEHDAKELLKRVAETDPDSASFDRAFDALRLAVLMHATREERYEFPQLRHHVSGARLMALGPALRAAQKLAPTRPHPGAESATANMALGLPLALVDKARDLFRSALKDTEDM